MAPPETQWHPILQHDTLFPMRIVSRRTLKEFVESRARQKDHPALKAAIDAWFSEVSKAGWRGMADVKAIYTNASVITSERIVFNIKGNDYRLAVAADFEKSIVWIKWIGRHRDHDRIDAKEVDRRD
jgi:mRNA interferase HigB